MSADLKTEHEYIVRATYYYEYKVTAENADEAERIVDDGEAGDGECTGLSVETVVSVDKEDDWRAEDERAKCVCGHLFQSGHTGLWSGELTKFPKPHPKACNDRRCACLAAVSAVTA